MVNEYLCEKLITSNAGAVAKYCDEHICVHVCVSVCMSVHEGTSLTACTIFTKFLCVLPIAVAYSPTSIASNVFDSL